MAVWIAQELGANNVLIVAPKRTQPGWVRSFRDVMGVEVKVCCRVSQYGVKPKEGKQNIADMLEGKPGVYFIGWELLRSIAAGFRSGWDRDRRTEVQEKVVKHQPLGGFLPDLIIADEWHRASNRESQNFRVLSSLPSTHRLALSATPAGSKPVDIWAAYQYLWPDRQGTYWRFADKHFYKVFDGGLFKGYGREKVPGLVREMAPCHVSITTEEANPELPEVVIHEVMVPLTSEQKRLYREFEREGVAWMEGHPYAVSLTAEIDLRLKQTCLGATTIGEDGRIDYDVDCKSSKIDALLDIMKDVGDEPVVVWVHSQRFIKAVVHRLRKAGYTAIEVSGKSRHSHLEMVEGKAQVIVAQHNAMAEGTDGLQEVCATEVWLSTNPSAVVTYQASGRLPRQGQRRTVNRYLVKAEGTVEERAIGRLQRSFESLEKSGFVA